HASHAAAVHRHDGRSGRAVGDRELLTDKRPLVVSPARAARREFGAPPPQAGRELIEASPPQALVAPEVAGGISTVLLELSGIAIGLVRIERYTLLVAHEGRPTRSRSDAGPANAFRLDHAVDAGHAIGLPCRHRAAYPLRTQHRHLDALVAVRHG